LVRGDQPLKSHTRFAPGKPENFQPVNEAALRGGFFCLRTNTKGELNMNASMARRIRNAESILITAIDRERNREWSHPAQSRTQSARITGADGNANQPCIGSEHYKQSKVA
jgi:hypothetical protein